MPDSNHTVEILAIVAKAPRPGESKTRLIPAVGPDGAARVAAAMLRDTSAMAASVALERSGMRVAVCFAPAGAEAEVRRHVPAAVLAVEQAPGSLGERLQRAFADLFATGAGRVVAIGSDSPTLPASTIGSAFEALRLGADVVIGPSRDGGYYLIGLRQPIPELFERVPWSTSRVLTTTLDRAADAGASVDLLPVWYDVDEPADLEDLAARLDVPESAGSHTRACLRELGYLPARTPEP